MDYKQKQKQKFETEFVPLLESPRVDIKKVLAMREEFDPAHLSRFLNFRFGSGYINYKKSREWSIKLFNTLNKTFLEEVLAPLGYVKKIGAKQYELEAGHISQDMGDYGMVQYLILGELKKGKKGDEKRYLTISRDYSDIGYEDLSVRPSNLIHIAGYDTKSAISRFRGNRFEEFITFPDFGTIDSQIFNLFDLKEGTIFRQKNYNYYWIDWIKVT